MQQRIPFHHHPCAQSDAMLPYSFLLSSFSLEVFSPKGTRAAYSVSDL